VGIYVFLSNAHRWTKIGRFVCSGEWLENACLASDDAFEEYLKSYSCMTWVPSHNNQFLFDRKFVLLVFNIVKKILPL